MVPTDPSILHDAALRILRDIGVHLDHEDMRDRLTRGGCRVREGRVFFGADVIGAALRRLPRDGWTLYGRSPAHGVAIGYQRMATMNAGVFPMIRDREGDAPRPATLADVASTTRLLDALDQVDLVFASLVDATDLAGPDRVPRILRSVLDNTTKPVVGPGVSDRLEARAVVRVAAELRGSLDEAARFPPVAPFVCASSPLRYERGAVEAMMVIADAGLPLEIITNPVAGMTAPFTLAGTIALGHAETLAGVVMAQTLRPGLPLLTQNTPSVADLRTIAATAGGPETGLMRQTITALSRWLGLPSHVSGHSSAWLLDVQAGEEKAINGLLIALAGPSILAGLGALGNAMIASPEALVLDNQRYAALRRVQRGVEVDEQRLDLEPIRQGIAAGEFLTLDHTLRHMETEEVWRPLLAHRGDATPPLAGQTIVDRARTEAERLLAEHRVEPVFPVGPFSAADTMVR